MNSRIRKPLLWLSAASLALALLSGCGGEPEAHTEHDPAEITPVASGTLDGQVEESEFVTYHYTIEGARDFSVVLVDGYEQRAATTGDTALRAWFTPEKGEAAEIALDRGAEPDGPAKTSQAPI